MTDDVGGNRFQVFQRFIGVFLGEVNIHNSEHNTLSGVLSGALFGVLFEALLEGLFCIRSR